MKALPVLPSKIDPFLPALMRKSPTQEGLARLLWQAFDLLEAIRQWAANNAEAKQYLDDAERDVRCLVKHVFVAGVEITSRATTLHLDATLDHYQRLAELCAFACQEAGGDMAAWEQVLAA